MLNAWDVFYLTLLILVASFGPLFLVAALATAVIYMRVTFSAARGLWRIDRLSFILLVSAGLYAALKFGGFA